MRHTFLIRFIFCLSCILILDPIVSFLSLMNKNFVSLKATAPLALYKKRKKNRKIKNRKIEKYSISMICSQNFILDKIWKLFIHCVDVDGDLRPKGSKCSRWYSKLGASYFFELVTMTTRLYCNKISHTTAQQKILEIDSLFKSVSSCLSWYVQ